MCNCNGDVCDFSKFIQIGIFIWATAKREYRMKKRRNCMRLKRNRKCNWKLSIESIGVGFVYLFLHKSHTCDYDSNKIVFAWIETSAFISIWVEPHWTWPMTWCYPLNITGNFILFMCSVHATAIYDLAFNSNACTIRILSAHCMSSRATPPMPTNTDIVRYVPLWHASVLCARANSQITSCA